MADQDRHQRDAPANATAKVLRGSEYVVERIDAMQLRAEPDRFGSVDALLARVGPVSEHAGDGLPLGLCSRSSACGRERGVEVGRHLRGFTSR